MLAKPQTPHHCWWPLRRSPGHSQMLETWHPQLSSWRSSWNHQVPCSGKVLSLVAIHLIWCRRDGQQRLDMRHTPSRAKGTPSSFILLRSSMGTPWDGPPEFSGRTYLAIVDYYSRWVETKLLTKQTSTETIHQIKSVFAAHGIPDVVVTDNGTWFSNQDFADFASSYGFTHHSSHQNCRHHWLLCSNMLPTAAVASPPAPFNQQTTLHTRSGKCVNKPKRLDLWSDNESNDNQSTVLPFHFDEEHILIMTHAHTKESLLCNQCIPKV